MTPSLLEDVVLLWTVVDPIGTIPVFIALSGGCDDRQRRRMAAQSILVAAGVLAFFAVLGGVLFKAMGVPLAAFQVGGGAVLFLLALDMIFGQSKPDEELALAGRVDATLDRAIFPLAIPSIAGPGAMLAVMLRWDAHRGDVAAQVRTLGALGAVLAATLLCLLAASRINRVIGTAGASLVSRVMGLLIAAVAAANVLDGVKAYFAG